MTNIESLLGAEAENLLSYKATAIPKDDLHLPGSDFVERVMMNSDRSPTVLRNWQAMTGHGRLAGTGYVSFLPVDQGVEHSAGASFAPNPAFFDPANICELAIEAGCNGVASTLGVLSSVARRYAHRIPFIVKINHNELLTYPNYYDQTLFASVDQAFDMGAVAVGATVYYRSPEARRQIDRFRLNPGYQVCYSLGSYEFNRLKSAYAAGLGNNRFHRHLLDGGELPFHLIEKRFENRHLK